MKLPELVRELPLSRPTNAVYVGTMKFTVESVEAFTEEFPSEHPSVAMLRTALTSAKAAYRVLDEAYAKTLRSAITDDISALDAEGDQLYMAVKMTAESAEKMTFDPARVAAAKLYTEMLKKYRIDTKENMISEWSKIQQLCEEAAQSEAIGQAEQTLGIATAMDRLTAISAQIRQKITERSGELPEAQQMKKTRAQMDPEYRVLIQVLNASAIIYGQDGTFDTIVKKLNDNINYVRIHAMPKGAASGDEPTPEPEPEPSPEPEPTPTPTPTPDPSGGDGTDGLDKG